MRFSRRNRKLDEALDNAEQIMARWSFAIEAGGVLAIRPTGHALAAAELSDFLQRVSAACRNEMVDEVVFDLSEVEVIGPQWTLVLALLIDFARNVDARCRVVALQGQPAAAASLYRRNRELMGLIEFKSLAA